MYLQSKSMPPKLWRSKGVFLKGIILRTRNTVLCHAMFKIQTHFLLWAYAPLNVCPWHPGMTQEAVQNPAVPLTQFFIHYNLSVNAYVTTAVVMTSTVMCCDFLEVPGHNTLQLTSTAMCSIALTLFERMRKTQWSWEVPWIMCHEPQIFLKYKLWNWAAWKKIADVIRFSGEILN